jgi:hypothetical protein
VPTRQPWQPARLRQSNQGNAQPDALPRINGLQTKVATAETEAETARTAAREATRAAETLRKAEADLRVWTEAAAAGDVAGE